MGALAEHGAPMGCGVPAGCGAPLVHEIPVVFVTALLRGVAAVRCMAMKCIGCPL